MILGHQTLVAALESGGIHYASPDGIPPVVGTNSIDVRLNECIIILKHNAWSLRHGWYTDVTKDPRYKIMQIPRKGMIIRPGQRILGCTVEEIGSDYYVPIYESRSTAARWFVQSHRAGFGDIGFKKQWTLEITVDAPTRLIPRMYIGQVFFIKPTSYRHRYGDGIVGNYANQHGPTLPKVFK